MFADDVDSKRCVGRRWGVVTQVATFGNRIATLEQLLESKVGQLCGRRAREVNVVAMGSLSKLW